ncbi:MAG: hypothetical protein QW728_04575, partial [Thermoplasmata archaeon]
MSAVRLGDLVLPASFSAILAPEIKNLSFQSSPYAKCMECPEAALGLRHPTAKCCQYLPSFPNFTV